MLDLSTVGRVDRVADPAATAAPGDAPPLPQGVRPAAVDTAGVSGAPPADGGRASAADADPDHMLGRAR
jgi:hypothetical protein